MRACYQGLLFPCPRSPKLQGRWGGQTVGWSPRRKCPFNQTAAKIPLPSPKRGRQHRQMDRLSRGRCKYILECAAVSQNSAGKFGISWKQMSFLLHKSILILIRCRLLHLRGNFYLLTSLYNNLAIDPSEIPDFSFPSAPPEPHLSIHRGGRVERPFLRTTRWAATNLLSVSQESALLGCRVQHGDGSPETDD